MLIVVFFFFVCSIVIVRCQDAAVRISSYTYIHSISHMARRFQFAFQFLRLRNFVGK